MKIAIIDYGSGNLRSAAKAFERAAEDAPGAAEVAVTADPKTLDRASHIVLPGVGAFADCMAGLKGLPGMVEALGARIEAGAPFLGICVGMQLMASVGEEHGIHPGFDWVPGRVVPIPAGGSDIRVPHMGWNELTRRADHPVLAGLAAGAHAYFVHSYMFEAADPAHVLAETEYGGRISAVVGRDNLIGTQFHPEKSQAVGLDLIARFLAWRP